MRAIRKFPKECYFRQILACLLVCSMFFSASIVLAKPKGRPPRKNPNANNQHGNNSPIPNLHINNPHSAVNPAGIITGSGGVRVILAPETTPTLGNAGPTGVGPTGNTGPKNITALGNPAPTGPGDIVFVGLPGSNVIVQTLPKDFAQNRGAKRGRKFLLAAGDVFSGAVGNLGSLSASFTVPDPIGAKGPNPHHGGKHLNKGGGNPGGRNGNGHWGEGNQRGGKGNNWTGNQGKGPGAIVFVGLPASNVIIQTLPKDFARNRGAKRGRKFLLAAGDVFSGALGNLDSLASSAASNGQSGNGRGHAWQGVDFNPGGGPDKSGEDGIGDKGWGTGNKGNGVGNTWVGNQGKGVGGGMAGGTRHDPDPDPKPDPKPDPDTEIEAAPLPVPRILIIGGCPALMNWLAAELGIGEEQLQLYIANALAMSADIHPCQMCARLRNAAGIVDDITAGRAAALADIITTELGGPLAGPPSPEQLAIIATALATPTEGTQYASAAELLDAVATYVIILTDELGWQTVDAIALFMQKHGAPITEDPSVATYIGAYLATLGG